MKDLRTTVPLSGSSAGQLRTGVVLRKKVFAARRRRSGRGKILALETCRGAAGRPASRSVGVLLGYLGGTAGRSAETASVITAVPHRAGHTSGNHRARQVFLEPAKEVLMDSVVVADRLRAIIVELDQVRRGLMADEPRRENYRKTVKAKLDAEGLLAQLEQEGQSFRLAAE